MLRKTIVSGKFYVGKNREAACSFQFLNEKAAISAALFTFLEAATRFLKLSNVLLEALV